ncbi:alpha/beta fold hydrolase [Marinilactibacillus psychrotolerans]|uniref:Alpha/beta fold hydrolase n=1 Tax=Marinilactibacillus psychrotolerans TaxID=191770 RepID=A0ABW8UNR7_9LACT
MKLERFKPFPTSDGALLQYFDIGEGKPLIVLAGAQTSVQTYRYVARELKKNYRVIGLERRFEGATRSSFEKMTMARQGQDIDEFISFVNLKDPVLIGHSLGSSVIMSYLSQFGDEKIASAIFVDQTPKMLNDSTWDAGVPGINEESISKILKTPILPLHKRPKLKVLWSLFSTMVLKEKSIASVKEKMPLYKDYLKGDWRKSLHQVSKPALFIGTEYSPFWPSRHAEICADLVQNGEFKIMEKVSHGAHMEDTTQFVSIVRAWIDQHGQ